MERGLQVPRFGDDLTRVGGYAVEGAEQLSRVLIPLERNSGGSISWRRAAPAGARIGTATKWSDYANGAGYWDGSGGESFAPPYGVLAPATARLIRTVLESAGSVERGFVVALCGVYGDLYRWLRRSGAPFEGPVGLPSCLSRHGAELIAVDDLNVLELAAADTLSRFPIGVWPVSLEWALAAPPYFDSMILSSSRDLFMRFAKSGLEVFPATAQQPNPIEGD